MLFRGLLAALVVVAGFFLPRLLGGGGELYSAFVLIAIFAVMAYGLDLIVSDLGEVSLCHTVFFAVGAYTTALMSTGLGSGPIMTFLGASLASLCVAALIGLITLKLREFVFSLVTYALAVVAGTLAQHWSFLGGSDGLRGIPMLALSLGNFTLAAEGDEGIWLVAYVLLLLSLWIIHSFRRSTLGQAAIMVHLNPRLAIMSGIDPARTRLQVFLLSAPVTASAGWLYAYQRAYISADVLDPYFLILMLTAVVLVGKRMLLGPIIGVALILIQERFFSMGAYVDKIILGSVLIAVLVLQPNGLQGLFARYGRQSR